MASRFTLLATRTVGKYVYSLFDAGGSGTFRYRLMRHNTSEGRYDTFTAATKDEFEKTMSGEWVKWKEPHGHQVIQENKNVGISEVVYQRLPPHPMTPEAPKGEVVKNIPKVTKD